MTKYRIRTDISADPEDRSWIVQKDEGDGWKELAVFDNVDAAMHLWNSLESSKQQKHESDSN